MYLKHQQQFYLVPPSAELRGYIQYYNIVFPQQGMFAPNYTLMPDACGTLSIAFDGASLTAELWGASIAPIPLGAEPNGYQVLLLIQLSPYGLYQITRQNQAELAGKRLALADIDSQLFHAFHHTFETAETIRDLTKACDSILGKRMVPHIISSALLLANQSVIDSHGQLQVKEIAHRAGYSERHLNRLFLTQIGMGVKNYARLIRFQSVLKRLQLSPCFFAALSQQAGYFDQAHFDKDFKAISGFTPQAYQKEMSDFYYDPAGILATLSSKEE